MSDRPKERTLEETPTWAVAVVCFVLLAISISIEHIIHAVGKWFKKEHKFALYEALEKVKGELMMMGFLSFTLTVLQEPISNICISRAVASTWHPCSSYKDEKKAAKEDDPRKLLEFSDPMPRRFLATKGYDKCGADKVAFVSAYGIHQLHVFIFVLAIFHILQCIITLGLGRTKMRKWKMWEDETKTVEYQFSNDPERFRFTRDTTFGRRHLHIWSRSSISLWIVCFFRQFFGSVTKVDYLALRHGFIAAHLAPGSEARFDFQKYIQRSLEEDFKVVVGISPVIWLFAVLFLLTNTNGWQPYYWLPFIPLIIILLVGAKLQMIITKMGLRIQERGEVVKGAPLVEPGDELFWFSKPRFLLGLIHFVLFQNAFQLAFLVWTTIQYGTGSCFHGKTVDSVIRLTSGILVQVLCSYATLPLYALVTQMGSTMKPTIFNDGVAAAVKNWHHTAKKHVKHGKNSEANTPLSSAPATPTHGMSPVHLLHSHTAGRSDSVQTSPRASNCENHDWDVEEGAPRPTDDPTVDGHEIQMMQVHGPSSMDLPPGPLPVRAQHEIGIAQFSFKNPHFGRDLR